MSRLVLTIIPLAVAAFPIVVNLVVPSALSRVSVVGWGVHVDIVRTCRTPKSTWRWLYDLPI